MNNAHPDRVPLKTLAALFLKIGVTGFGGPAAHIALFRQEFVHKRQWLTEQHFLDLLGATNLIPGPNSTEMAIHIGYEKGGWKGWIVAGFCFIFPAVVLTGILAWLYKDYGSLPEVKPFLYGIQPALIAIILAAIYPMAMTVFKSIWLVLIGLTVLTLSLLGIGEIYLLFGAGFIALFFSFIRKQDQSDKAAFTPILLGVGKGLLAGINGKLGWTFLKIGALLYGSGYVLFAFMDTELVATGLLSRRELIDAMAVGQFTPGPVFSSVTFAGYQINGWSGALVSTIAVFLPAFVFVLLLNPLVKRVRNSTVFSTFLDAVNGASVAIILSICSSMGKEVVTDWRTVVIALLSIAVVFRFPKLNSAFIVIGGSAAGYLLQLL